MAHEAFQEVAMADLCKSAVGYKETFDRDVIFVRFES